MRVGLRQNPNSDAVMGEPVHVDVQDEACVEYWTQEIQVIHYPNADQPLPFGELPGSTHHSCRVGHLESFGPTDVVLSSFTMLMEYAQIAITAVGTLGQLEVGVHTTAFSDNWRGRAVAAANNSVGPLKRRTLPEETELPRTIHNVF